MDPLSLTASIIAVATFAGQVSRAFAKLRTLCVELPGRLHALNNEVADIEIVLFQVASVVRQRSLMLQSDETTIPHLLNQANTKLNELQIIIDSLIETCTRKTIVLRATAWRKQHPKLQSLQEDIKTVKSSFNIMLGASNSRDLMRVRLDIESLSMVSSQSLQTQDSFRNEFLAGLTQQQEGFKMSIEHNYQQVDQRISRVEELLNAQSAQFQANQSSRIEPFLHRTAPPYQRRPSRTARQNSPPRLSARSEGVGVRVSQYSDNTCRTGCLCACHARQTGVTPGFADRILGRLFVGYAGLALFSPKCDIETCQKNQSAHLGYRPNLGPHMQVSTLRRVSDSAQCVTFALEGNIEGLKNLFKQGLASPRDVSSTRGYSILRWALYGQQYETCKFLMSAGADPDYSPISPNDECPSDKACDIVLRGGLTPDVVDILRCLTTASDFIENQNFAPIHKIVLKLMLGDLEEEILRNPCEVDITDITGRTALEWAAARGDERAVTTLLSYGADPNSMDKKLNTPLTLAANQNQTVCVRLLLEAGAEPDPILPNGIKFGTPLNCAARNASDPLLLKTLLDFNANIEASNVDGVTPLLHVSRSQTANHAMLLLEYGADINVMSKDGRTPLTTAIAYNNHGVLQLLLDRWFEYSECPRLKGPHLLQFVAKYADMKTISILSSTSHLKMKFDKDYVIGDFAHCLEQRADATEKLILAFKDLLSIIGQEARLPDHRKRGIESSLLQHPRTNLEDDDSDSASSEECFEDAQESFKLLADDKACIFASIHKRATL